MSDHDSVITVDELDENAGDEIPSTIVIDDPADVDDDCDEGTQRIRGWVNDRNVEGIRGRREFDRGGAMHRPFRGGRGGGFGNSQGPSRSGELLYLLLH